MRYIYTIVLLFSLLNANHILWLGNYDKALKIAYKENKPLMVLLVKKDCQKCKDVIAKEFTNNAKVDELNKKYISVIITYNSKVSYPIELYYSTTFPTLFFVDSKTETFLKEPIYY